MTDFAEKMPQVPGFGIECMLAVQTLNQIDEVYGDKNSVVENCDVFVTFAVSNDRVQRRIADMIGKAPEIRATESTTRSRNGQSVSVGETRAWQQVMDTGAIRVLPETDQLVLKLGCLPWLAKKVRYDQEPDFRSRLLPAVIEPPTVQYDPAPAPVTQAALVPQGAVLEKPVGDMTMRNLTDFKAGRLIAEAFGQDMAELRGMPHVTDIAINNDDGVWAMQNGVWRDTGLTMNESAKLWAIDALGHIQRRIVDHQVPNLEATIPVLATVSRRWFRPLR